MKEGQGGAEASVPPDGRCPDPYAWAQFFVDHAKALALPPERHRFPDNESASLMLRIARP
jgi:hypothetical protein